MLNTKKWLISTAGTAAVLTMLLGSTAIAQDAVTNEAIVPEAAKTSQPDKGAVIQSDYPIPEQLDNNDAVIETLIEQGFSDIHILRKAAIMTVTATRDGQPIELVYNVSSGRLVSVDGEELDPTIVDDTGEGQAPNAANDTDTDDSDDGATDDGAADDGTSDDGSTDDGTSDDGTSDDGTADDGTSDDGTSDDGSSDGGTSDDGASDDGSSTGDGSDSDTSGDTGSSDGGDSGSDSDSGDGSDSGGSDSGESSGG